MSGRGRGAILGALLVLGTSCGATPTTETEPTSARRSTLAPARQRDEAPPRIVLKPERCEFEGVPARRGNSIIVSLGTVTPHLASQRIDRASWIGRSVGADVETIARCCDEGDLDACAQASVEVDAHMVPLERLDPNRDRWWLDIDARIELTDDVDWRRDPSFVGCRCVDADPTDPTCLGDLDSDNCFFVHSEVTVGGERRWLIVDVGSDVHLPLPPELERFRDGAWETVEPTASGSTGETCAPASIVGPISAWIDPTTGLIIIGYGLEVPMQSRCEPGAGFALFALPSEHRARARPAPEPR